MHAAVRLVSLLALLVLPFAPWARADVADRQLQHYVVEPGGAYRLTVEDVRAAGGTPALDTYVINYSAAREQVLSIEAYLHKPDGRRLPVPPAQIQERPRSTAPALGDMRLRTIAFSDAAPGDRLVVRYAIRGSRALFPGHFEDLVVAPSGHGREVQVIYDMPPGLPLYADAIGFAPVPAAHPAGRLRYQWRHVAEADVPVEAGAVSPIDHGRRLAVSTFAGYPAFAAALRQGMAGKAAPTPPIAALARQVVAAVPNADAHARALLLAGWVRRNVRHVDTYPGADGVTPRTAASVLASGYGDCKDHAMLLAALLKAVDIDSTPALVNNGAAYRLPDVPTIGVFNHMITYVPSLGLYLDSTAQVLDAGRLPAALLGKPVLLVHTGTFAMTPLLQPQKRVAAATVDVGHDARARGRTPVALATLQPAGSPVSESLAGMTQEKERRLEYVCPAVDARDDTEFRLPAGTRIVSLPSPVNLVHGGLFYQARYARKTTAGGKAVVVTRRLTFRHGSPTCTPADYRAMRPALERIGRDLDSRIVVAGP